MGESLLHDNQENCLWTNNSSAQLQIDDAPLGFEDGHAFQNKNRTRPAETEAQVGKANNVYDRRSPRLSNKNQGKNCQGC